MSALHHEPNYMVSRRHVLRTALTSATLASLPTWFSREAMALEAERLAAQPRRIGPNDTIHLGVIGPGGPRGGFRQGLNVAKWMATKPGVRVVAVCDVDEVHLDHAANEFGALTRRFVDYRELLRMRDLDAVVIGTPDHWHHRQCVDALRAGKDVFCEKPLTLDIAEGRDIVREAERHRRVFQTGSQQRSDHRFRLACELVRNGRIGKLLRVRTHLPTGPVGGPFVAREVPADLNWNLWLGPAPMTDYMPERTHGNFRWWMDYSGGMLTDWGAHHNDIAQWGMGTDHTGPISVEATGKNPPMIGPGYYNTFPEYEATYKYANGVTLVCTNQGENGVRFEGEEGWIFVSRGKIEASDFKFLEEPLAGDAIRLEVSDDHAQNFLDAIRSRQKPICHAEVGHRSVTICHLANICLRLGGRQLNWDPQRERFTNSEEANRLLSRPARRWD